MQINGINIDVIEISVLLTLLGIIIYYFGKVIAEARPHRELKAINYINGFYYVAVYISIPLVAIYTGITGDYHLKWYVIILLLAQVVMVDFLNHNLLGVKTISKFGLGEKVKKEAVLRSKKTMKKLEKVWSKLRWRDDFKEGVNYLLAPKKPIHGILINIVSILASVLIVTANVGLVYKYVTLLFSFLILTSVAYLINAQSPWVAEVVLKNGQSIKGKVNKIENGYVTVLQNENIYHIKSDYITMIKRKAYCPREVNKILKKGRKK